MKRFEITFSSGKFIAYEHVVEDRLTEDTMILKIQHTKYENNIVVINLSKIDFYEVFYN